MEIIIQDIPANNTNLCVNTELVNIVSAETTNITFTDIGNQGIVGARGSSIQYVWSDTRLGIKNTDEINYVFSDLKGPKGPKGDTGNNLNFSNLTDEQKLELRGDVGNTTTNYVNIFYENLL